MPFVLNLSRLAEPHRGIDHDNIVQEENYNMQQQQNYSS